MGEFISKYRQKLIEVYLTDGRVVRAKLDGYDDSFIPDGEDGILLSDPQTDEPFMILAESEVEKIIPLEAPHTEESLKQVLGLR
jgi:hypothetical protein